MRKTLFFAVILSLALCMGVNAYTDESGRHCAGNLDELREEVKAAQDGDTIYITEMIYINGDVTLDSEGKEITLACDTFTSAFEIRDSAVTFRGITFDGCNRQAINILGNSILCEDCTFSRCRNGIFTLGCAVELKNCTFSRCYHLIANAIDLTMENCTVENCIGGGACIDCKGDVQISGCTFKDNCLMDFQAVFSIERDGNAQFTDCLFIGNRAPMAEGAAIYGQNCSISLSRCVFADNRADGQGDIYFFAGNFAITDTDEELAALYATHDYDFSGITVVGAETRRGAVAALPFAGEVSRFALAFEAVETPPAPVVVTQRVEVPVEKIVEKPVTVAEYVPVYHTETVEKVIEKPVEVTPATKTATLNGVTLTQDTAFLSGYFAALKGKPATRADVAVMLYMLAGEKITATCEGCEYTDVAESAPYAEAVAALSRAGLFNGVGGGRFAPDQAMKKGQVVAVLTRLLGIEPMESTGSWASGYLAAAQAQGFALGASADELGDVLTMEELRALLDELFL